MNQNRRRFIKTGITLGAAVPIAGTGLLSCLPQSKEGEEEQSSESKKLKILILGGTSFIGPHQIAYALERGHSVSIFTRGKTKPTVHQELLDQVEQLIGDRENDLEALKNRSWDVVIDNSGRKVEWTDATAKLLKDKVDLYLYTSSTGVYYPYLVADVKEDAKLVLEMPESLEDEEMKYEYAYGIMKANSEIAVKNHFGDSRSIIVRPTYMIGPADLLDRFIHWPVRLSRGGEVLVPGKPEDPVQFIDVRDVAEFMIRLAESSTTGTFNAVGPDQAMTMEGFITEAGKSFDKELSFITIDDYEFLKEQKLFYLVPWIMPEGNNYASALENNDLAIANGMKFTPLVKSIRDIHNWWYSDALTEERRQKYEANPDTILMREAEILKAWKKWSAS